MKPPPIFVRTEATPEPGTAPGIVLAPPPWKTDRAAWVHGVLTVDEDEGGRDQWLAALHVVTVTELGSQPQVAAVLRAPRLQPPKWIDSGYGLLHLPFSLEINTAPPHPLQAEPTWVYVGAGRLAAPPLRLAPGVWGGRTLPKTPADALVHAYSRMLEGDASAAMMHFAHALEDGELAADVESAHVFHAACAAAQALATDPRATRIASQRGLAWVVEDVARRAQRLREIAMALVVAEGDAAGRLEAEQAAHTRHLRELRAAAELAPLRDLPEYRQLFAQGAPPAR